MLSSFVILQYSGVNIGPVHKKDIMKCSTMLEHDSQWVPFNLIQQIYVMVARPPLIKIFLSQPFARLTQPLMYIKQSASGFAL